MHWMQLYTVHYKMFFIIFYYIFATALWLRETFCYSPQIWFLQSYFMSYQGKAQELKQIKLNTLLSGTVLEYQ